MTLIKDNLTVLTRVHDNGVDLRVTYYGSSRQKIAQTQFQNVKHVLVTVQNSHSTIKVIQIWVWFFSRHYKVYLLLEVVTNLLLNFFNRQFWLQVSLSVKLSCLYIATKLAVFTCGFQNDAIGWNLLFIA